MQGHYRNGFNRRNEEYEEDGYEDYKEYGIEDEADDAEEIEEEPKPNKEELEFLKLREQLKEKFRQKLKKQSSLAFGLSNQSQERKRTPTNDNFGCFFGPSQPVIASRVLDESRSIRETQHIKTQHITSKVSSSSSERQGVSSFTSPERKLNEGQCPKVTEVRRKAQTLKSMRDYSFLFSDDNDLPDKEPLSASAHPFSPKPDSRTAQTPLKSKSPVRELKNMVPTGRQMQTKVPMKEAKVSKTLPSSGHYVGGNGPSKPSGPKPSPKHIPSSIPQQFKIPAQVPLKPKLSGQAMGANNPGTKALNGLSLYKNLSTSKPYPSTQKHYVEQKRESQAPDRVRTVPKPAQKPAPLLKTQTIPSRDIRVEHLKKKPVKRRLDEDEDADEAIQMIRNMFGYNPSKYAGMDDDDSDMEADFSQIQKEEWRSARIARKEDDEQLRLLEEEERREMMRKKQKLNRR